MQNVPSRMQERPYLGLELDDRGLLNLCPRDLCLPTGPASKRSKHLAAGMYLK